MQFNTNALALLAALASLVAAAPSEATVGGRAASDPNVLKRQTQYQCTSVPPNELSACNAAIPRLRAIEANGCDVWGCIAAFGGTISACGAAIDEFFLNPAADLACITAVSAFQGPCQNCEPW